MEPDQSGASEVAVEPRIAAYAVVATTHIGRVRRNNEDAFMVRSSRGAGAAQSIADRFSAAAGDLLMMVCDGMGGAAAGEVAARLACDAVTQDLFDAGVEVGTNPSARLAAAVRDAGAVIYAASRDKTDRRGMGTTCTAGLVVEGRLALAQVGDSRAYLFRGGVLRQLTRDQSMAWAMVEAGVITKDEAKDYPYGNVILQALGVERSVEPEILEVELAAGDLILLCTDGLHGPVPDQAIAGILSEGKDVAERTRRLIEAALSAGAPDNVTVLLAECQ